MVGVSDLTRLAQRFPRELVQRDPGGNRYVAHENVTQWLLGVVGPFSFELVEGVWRLTLQVDGRTVRLEEAGDVEDPHNWRHDGQRLKQAASDAIKRCAMRAGLGLHLWAGERYVLDQRLSKGEPSTNGRPS